MYLHARMFFTLADTTSIPRGAIYLHARIFCTLAHMSSIPMGAMYLQITCKNVLDIRSYNLYTCGCDVSTISTCKNFQYIRSYNLYYTCGCNVFTCKNVLYTLWYDLIPIAGANFYRDNRSLAPANRAMFTNNLIVIIEIVLTEVMLIEGFLYCQNKIL